MRISGHSGAEGSHHAPSAPPQTQTPATGRYAAAVSRSTTSELSLTTAEGDKVVLSISRGSTNAVASEGGDYASLRTRQSSVNIQVDGDLNAEELEDIQKLARIVSRAASDVLRGNTDRAERRLGRADKLDSIQSFAFSLNQQVAHLFSYQERSTPA